MPGVGSAGSDKVNETLSRDIITVYGNNISDDINMVSRLRDEGYMMGWLLAGCKTRPSAEDTMAWQAYNDFQGRFRLAVWHT